MTYAELDNCANRLVGELRVLIAGGCVVAILLPRNSSQLYAAQLAVLKAGAAYTCLDPSFPDERIVDVLEDADVAVLLTDSTGTARVRSFCRDTLQVIDVGATSHTTAPIDAEDIFHPAWLTPHKLAYVIYTSGTTGRPKGVMIEHRSIVNLVASDLETFRLSAADRVAQGSSAAYDSSVEETWLAFAAGATLVVMDDDAARSGPDLIDWLAGERISVFCPPPTQLRATGCEDPQSALPELRLLYVGGEALPRDLADLWSRGRRMVNGYGPTECTVTCLRDEVLEGQPITIGVPVDGVRALVLNEALEELAPGEQGELCLGGVALARGYWKSPGLTAEKFIDHSRFGRLYRTGDLVHCDATGQFVYHGRIDSQVKLRGYRIELGEIEARLIECSGVRAAACRLGEHGGSAVLEAYVVPMDSSDAPAADDIKIALTKVLPDYMVPRRIGFLEELPVTIGGKLNRAALPAWSGPAPFADAPMARPRNDMESRIEAAFARVLRCKEGVSIHADFFHDLGGDSLAAALLVTTLRDDPLTAWVTARDIYAARNVAELAGRAQAVGESKQAMAREEFDRSQVRPLLVTMLQVSWLLGLLVAGSAGSWLVGSHFLPWLAMHFGLLPLVLLAPLFGIVFFTIYSPLSVVTAVAVKRLLIGRYRAMRAPVWGGFYLRNWVVQQSVRMIPWRMIEGTTFQLAVLRALGARIGQRVYIQRGVDLSRGGWDLLEIGDDVTIGRDAALRLVILDKGEIVIGPVTLGDGATVDTRAGVSAHAVMEADSFLNALSSLTAGATIPRGERWDGIPAKAIGPAPETPSPETDSRNLTPWQHGMVLMLSRAGFGLLLALPTQLMFILACLIFHLSWEELWACLDFSAAGWAACLVGMFLVVLTVPTTLAWMALVLRMLGRVGEGVISRWSLAYVRVLLKISTLESAGKWLSGTLFWPLWLRMAGMKIGGACEVSTITDVVPELIEIGTETFFADGIYLGGPIVRKGTVRLARTRLGKNTFLGNHVVITAGQQLPDDILLGICTPADDKLIRPGSSWFGHPPFELPRREVVEMDRRLTHNPSAIRYANRVFWELLRFTLPVVPVWVSLAWLRVLVSAATAFPPALFLLVIVPLVTFSAMAFSCLFILAMKWILLGRVRPGQHALWSCWCSRWDFLYVAWGQLAMPLLEKLEGTLLLTCYLRAIGMKIGKRVVLGRGFSQVVDPDMIEIGDEATVNAKFQAHTFEDRVLKIDRVIIGRGATLAEATVPLYGANIGERTHVAEHSVIMKREHLSPGLKYEGAPTRSRNQ